MTREERFWAKVKKTNACWIWTACIARGGYGIFNGPEKVVVAHRFSWEMAHGKIPVGQQVCHKCDNPACVRPDHLFLGTQSENLRDCSEKGRIARGARNGNARLSAKQVEAIRTRYTPLRASNANSLATEFGLNRSTIFRLVQRERKANTAVPDEVRRAIRARFNPGNPGNDRELATEFGVDRTTIHNVVKRDWRHIT